MRMTIEIRPATDAEMGQLGLLTSYVYGGAFGDGMDNVPATSNRAEWTLCAFDGARMVASSGAIPFTMRANGNAMAMAGVSVVGTLPEYRRRGLLRRITELSFQRMREAGQPVAALWASQAAIYQRYGYSRGSLLRHYGLNAADAQLLPSAGPDLPVTRHSAAEAFDVMREVYRQFIARRTLYLHRAKPLWHAGVLREDAALGPVHVAVCRDAAEQPRGYVAYTLRAGRVDHPARGQELVVRDLVWLDIDACRALWAFLARHDLVGRIAWRNAPADDPAPELFVEPRMLQAGDTEGLWFRVVDVEQALAGRGYDADGEVVLGIPADRETPWNEGTYRLTVSGGDVRVARTTRPAEVTVPIKALSSAFTGFQRMRQLANWGLVSGDERAIARADALLATRYSPHCPDHF
jgi:predicted acetyltransferase